MKTKLRILLATALVLLLALGITGVALAGDYIKIPLNNDTAEEGTDCPTGGGPYWHFVISPNNGNSYFIVFHLNLGDVDTYDTSVFVPNGSQMDNVFVTVPGGKTLTSLIKDGSSAEIYWNGDGSDPDKFQLSHVCPGVQDLDVTKTADASYTRTFDWTIEKTADKSKVFSRGGGESEAATFTIDVVKDAGTNSDWAVSGKVTVHNPNTFDVSGVNVTDDVNGFCQYEWNDLTVPAGGDVELDYLCTLLTEPEYDVTYTNTATATWPDIGSPNTSDTDTDDFTFSAPTKLVNDCVTVKDSNGKEWTFCESGTVSYEMTYNDPAGTCTDHVNTAKVIGDNEVVLGEDDATVTDCQGADLTIDKTVNASYDLKYKWDIIKTALEPTSQKVDPGQPATFDYEVLVSHDEGTPGNWKVWGEITVTNPNDWEDIIADVTDVIDNGGVCKVEGGVGVLIPKSDSVTLPYTCTYESAPTSMTFVNTATATWEDIYYTPNTSVSKDVPGEFKDPNLIDECVDVTDDHLTGTIKQVCVGDPNPTKITYSLSFPGPIPGGTCKDYQNIATATTIDTETQVSDDAWVTVCSWKSRLTPGYWKNHLTFAKQYLPLYLGEFEVKFMTQITSVFKTMNCNNLTTGQNAVGCLAGHLLAAKLNVANGANTCIVPRIDQGDAFLIGVGYKGPGYTYTFTPTWPRSLAITIKTALDKYNNNLGCH